MKGFFKDLLCSIVLGGVLTILLVFMKPYATLDFSGLIKAALALVSGFVVNFFFKQSEEAKLKVKDFRLAETAPINMQIEVRKIQDAYSSSDLCDKAYIGYVIAFLIFLVGSIVTLNSAESTYILSCFSFFSLLSIVVFSCFALSKRTEIATSVYRRLSDISSIENRRQTLIASLVKTKSSFSKRDVDLHRRHGKFDIGKYVNEKEKERAQEQEQEQEQENKDDDDGSLPK